MACGNAFDGFRTATEYLADEIYTKAGFDSIFMNLIPSGTYAPHSGLTHNYFTLLKQEPTNEERVGDVIVLSTGSTLGACGATWQDVALGFNEGTYSPVQLDWRGPIFCKDDQYFHHLSDDFIGGYVSELTDYVKRDLENHFFYHYSRRVPIYVATATFGEGTANPSTTLTAPVATTELTQQMMDRLTARLIYDRASKPDGKGWIEMGSNGIMFTAWVGIEALQRLKTNNIEFRTDLRYGDPSALLMRLGAQEAIKNFKYLPNALPARYTHDGTKYVRVPTFVSTAGTKGTGTDVNPNWINPATAPYEAALVLSPYVMTSEKIKPASTVGPVTWKDTNYMGEWMWVTGNDALSQTDGDGCMTDPLHKRGRHFAQYKHALKPGPTPRSGAIIFFKRCVGSIALVACS